MIEISLALLASIIAGMVESKVGDALYEGLVRIKYALRKPLRTAFQKAVDEVIKETKENDVVVRTALLDLKSRWETLKVEENKRLDRDNIYKVFEKSVVPEEYCAKLYDRINEKFLKVFADVAKKREGIFVDHVILSLNKLQKESYEREKDMERLLLFCQNFGLDTAKISAELGKIQKSLVRIERVTKATKSGVERIEERIQHLTDILWLQMPNSARLTDEQMRLLKKAERTAEEPKDESVSLLLQAENEIVRGNYPKAKILLNDLLEMAKIKNDEGNMVNAYGLLSMIDIDEANFNEGVTKLNYIVEMSKKQRHITNLVRAFNNLGWVYFKQGDLDKALNTFGLAQSMAPDEDYYSLGMLARNIGKIMVEKGDCPKAQQKYKESMHFLKKAIREEDETEKVSFIKQLYAALLCDISYLSKINGDYQGALRRYKESIKIFKQLKDNLGTIRAKGDMADIFCIQGRYSDALRLVKDGLDIVERLQNNKEIAEAKQALGRIYLRMEEFDLAQKSLEESLSFFTQVNDRLQALHVSHELALVYEHKGDVNKALKLHEQNLKLSTELGDKLGMAITKHQLGVLYERSFDLDTAKRLFEDALRISKEIGYKDEVARALYQIAGIYSAQSQYPRAIELYQESLTMAKELGNLDLISIVISGIANLHTHQEKYHQAIEEYRQAVDILKRLNKKRSLALALFWLGNVYKLIGNSEEALKSYNEGLGFAEASCDKEGVGTLMGHIGILFYEKKDFAKATYYLTSASFTLGEVNSPNKRLIDEYMKRVKGKPI